MIETSLSVMENLKNYASPKARLTRLLGAGKLIQVRRGLFVDDTAVSRRALAPLIYGPSYISFQYALASYGLIPERVEVVTCASFNKNKNKLYHTPFGAYRYLYLPTAVYPYGLRLAEDEGASYLIASEEKALCDAVYKAPAVTTVTEMDSLLLDDWRMDPGELGGMDRDFISWLAPMYGRKALRALVAWFKRGE